MMKRERLIQERTKRKMSRALVAESLGISEVYVRMIENGTVKPGRDTMIRFSEFFEIGLKTLFPEFFLRMNDKKFIKTGTE